MAINISGTLYLDRGVTVDPNLVTLNVSVNGAAAAGTTVSLIDGTYTFLAITAASGAILTVYIQDAVNTEKSATVTKSTGVDMTGIDLYQDYLILRSDSGVALTGANLNTSDANGATGISAIYAASSLATTIVSGKHLFVAASQTATLGSSYGVTLTAGNAIIAGAFTPGTQGLTITSGNFSILSGGSYGGNNCTVGGNFSNAGTFAPTAGTFTMTGTGSQTILSGGGSFGRLTIQAGVIGTYTLLDDLIISVGNLSLTSGTLDVSPSNFTITAKSNIVVTSGAFVPRAGTIIFNGSGAIVSSAVSYHNLTLTGSVVLLTDGSLVVGGSVTIGANATFNAQGFLLTVGGNWINNGSYTTENSSPFSRTVTLNGTAQTIAGSTTFYNLIMVTPGDVVTFTDGTTQTVSNSFTAQNVTLQGSGVGGWTIAMPSTQTIDHVTVSRSTATGNTAVAGSTSTDGGNNTNWTFGDSAGSSRASDGKSF